MNAHGRWTPWVAGVAAGLAIATAAWADPGDAVVKARSFTIRRGEIDDAVERLVAGLKAQGREPDAAQRAEAFERILGHQLFFRLCRARATDADREKARTDAEAFIAGRRRELGPETLDRLLREAGHTPESFAEAKRAEALVTAVVDREVGSGIRIPSADIRAYYDEHREDWTEPAQVRLDRLVVAPADPAQPDPGLAKVAADLRDRAAKGESFERLGAGPGYRLLSDRVTVPAGSLDPGVESEVSRLKPGELGKPLATPAGYLVVRLVERIPERTRALSEVEADIRGLLEQRELEVRVPEFFARIQKEEGVERLPVEPGTAGDP